MTSLHRTHVPGAAEAPHRTMRAVVRDRYSDSPNVLHVADIAVPTIADDEVLVRVHAAGVDRGAWHVMAGQPYVFRLAGIGVRRPKATTFGSDAAGVVAAVGKAVTGIAPGDEVFGICKGSFAEYAVASPGKLATKPANRSFEEAAAVPVSSLTALQALRDKGHLQAGQRVLIIGASGGVGTFAVQIATAFGAHVTGVCSTAKVALVRSIGADEVVDYTCDEITDSGHRYDLVLDIGGGRSVSQLRRVLTERGTLVIVGGESGGPWFGGIDRQLRATLLSMVVRQRLGTLLCRENSGDLETIRELIEAGKVKPIIDRVGSLHDLPATISDLAAGRVRGKAVIVPDPTSR